MNYQVQLAIFEGPVELLLYLVRKNELDVLDIPIGQLTDDYLTYLRQLVKINIEHASDFILMASILLRLKMRSLLPSAEAEPQEEAPISLEQIIEEFKKYEKAAKFLSSLEEKRQNLFPRPGEQVYDYEGSGDIFLLTQIFNEVLAKIAPKESLKIEPRKIRIEEKIEFLRSILVAKKAIDFLEVVKDCVEIGEVIALFFATLELIRLGEIMVKQDYEFGTIRLIIKEPNQPDLSA
uniref:Segregation and condensation protein A n=1 Tax=candidate division WOR-3 bacterium TaxID=2052148 RepID=A0A7C6A9G9_UNCW3